MDGRTGERQSHSFTILHVRVCVLIIIEEGNSNQMNKHKPVC